MQRTAPVMFAFAVLGCRTNERFEFAYENPTNGPGSFIAIYGRLWQGRRWVLPGSHIVVPESLSTPPPTFRPARRILFSPFHFQAHEPMYSRKSKQSFKTSKSLWLAIPTNIALGPLGFRAALDVNPKGERNRSCHELSIDDLILFNFRWET